MLENYASFFNVISTASLWDLRLWLQWGEGMWACVRIESTCVNVFSHRTYYNAVFIVFFLRCLRQMKVHRRMVQIRRLLAALLDDRARLGEDWTDDAGQSFDSEWNLVFIEYSHFVQVQYNMLMYL